MFCKCSILHVTTVYWYYCWCFQWCSTMLIIAVVSFAADRLTDNFLLFVDPQMKASYQVDLTLSESGPQDIRGIDLPSSNMPTKVAYDLTRDVFYWHDNELTGRNSIKRMSLTGHTTDEHSLTTLAHGTTTANGAATATVNSSSSSSSSSSCCCCCCCCTYCCCRCRCCRIYTVSHKKTCHCILDHNSYVSWWIFALLVPTETGMNTLQRSYEIYNFTLTVSPHYLIKLKPHKTAHFEVNRHVFYYSTARMSLWTELFFT